MNGGIGKEGKIPGVAQMQTVRGFITVLATDGAVVIVCRPIEFRAPGAASFSGNRNLTSARLVSSTQATERLFDRARPTRTHELLLDGRLFHSEDCSLEARNWLPETIDTAFYPLNGKQPKMSREVDN